MVFRKRQWHPTPVLLPGESHRQRSLVGCSLWGRSESDMSLTWQTRVGHDWSDLAAVVFSARSPRNPSVSDKLEQLVTVVHRKCFPGDSGVKNLPALQETQEIRVRSMGQEDSLEKEMATHSSILAWEILWTEETGGCIPWSRKESNTSEQLSMHAAQLNA